VHRCVTAVSLQTDEVSLRCAEVSLQCACRQTRCRYGAPRCRCSAPADRRGQLDAASSPSRCARTTSTCGWEGNRRSSSAPPRHRAALVTTAAGTTSTASTWPSRAGRTRPRPSRSSGTGWSPGTGCSTGPTAPSAHPAARYITLCHTSNETQMPVIAASSSISSVEVSRRQRRFLRNSTPMVAFD